MDQQNVQMGKQQAEQADTRAWRMEEISLRVQDLTEDMHHIARETREETISMRIMAFVALLFLPGTFASVRSISVCPVVLPDRLIWTDNDGH